jgi:DNA modification methylase
MGRVDPAMSREGVALAQKAQCMLFRKVSRQKRKASVKKEPGAAPFSYEHPPDAGSGSLVLQGDAYDLAAQLAHSSIDLIITSPPYLGLRTYGLNHNWEAIREWKALGKTPDETPPYDWYRRTGGVLGLEPIPDWYVHHLSEILGRLLKALKPGGSLWVNLGDTYFARWSSIRDRGRQGLGDNPRIRRRMPMGGYRQEKQLLLIPARFAIHMQENGWILRNDVIWYKPNAVPRPEGDRLRLTHEHLFHFVLKPKEGRAKYYYDANKAEPGCADVITCNVTPGQNGHSATFPEELVLPRIESSCPPGGVVLDPFCGTGRALYLALATGRKAIGFDLIPGYCDASREAIAAFLKPPACGQPR